jgi:methyltransferase (TIGR00027 family)
MCVEQQRSKGMSEQEKSGSLLGNTARWTAGVRARESRREDRLFHDPWAAALAGLTSEEWTAPQSGDDGVSIVVRTRFFDDFLQRVTGEYGIRQVVLLAAGFDTRAFRLSWPASTRLFELDQPQVLREKEAILRSAGAAASCERHTIEADLTSSWTDSLLKTGFDTQEPAGWLLEGFLFYIPGEDIVRILDEITGLAAAGSWLGFDCINNAMLTSPWTREWLETLAKAGVPWIGTLDDPQAFLAGRGWQPTLTQAGENRANYGRWPYPVMPRELPDMPRDWFVTAQKL